jgi:hypothetical protein
MQRMVGTMKTFSIAPNGDTAIVSVREDFFGFFEDLYDTIDAYGADYVGINTRLGIWVDDYGRLGDGQRNPVATQIAKAMGYTGEIYGKVLFSGPFIGNILTPLAPDSIETLQLMSGLINKELARG